MELARDHFSDFFAAVNDGNAPHAWQRRLFDHLIDTGTWPERLVAPTGAGKTSVVDVHVFANALSALGLAPRLPRRLAMVVDRRVVVDSHDEHARAIAIRLRDHRGGVVGSVADALRQLTVDGPEAGRAPLVTVRIRGGSPAPRSWLDEVDSCAVLACTPDMWGSRLLFRGYGSSRTGRPRAAGLLTLDAVVVVDEAHLSRQLMATARRVAELQRTTSVPDGVPVLQVVETTATPDEGAGRTEIGVLEEDLTPAAPLTPRMTSPKPVTLLSVPDWPVPKAGPLRRAAVEAITERVVELRAEVGATVGCVLDTVALAVDVAAELRQRRLAVELIVGRLRPADVEDIKRRRPDLLGPHGNTGVDVLVATQTVEVGIDLDLAGMVTELAPGTALAQRAGRVNRAGRRPSGPITVVVPKKSGITTTTGFPYEVGDLVAALEWLSRVAGDPDGLTPWRARNDPPPSAASRRLVDSRLEHADSWMLARTSEEQFAEPFLDLWLSDDLDSDADVGLVARVLPDDEVGAIELLRLTPPEGHEVYPVSIKRTRELLEPLFTEEGRIRPLVVRNREARALVDAEDRLRPGDVVVLVPDRITLTAGVPTVGGIERSRDVFETGRPRGVRRATLRLGAGTPLSGVSGLPDAVSIVLAAADEEVDTRAGRDLLADALASLGRVLDSSWGLVVERTVELLHGRLSAADVVVSGDTPARRLVIVDRQRALADEDLRQTWRTDDVDPTLAGHREEVATRAERLGRVLGLGDDLVDTLRIAGAHHDDGKADDRFQRMLRFSSSGEEDGPPVLLAKSSRRSVLRDELARAAGGLPPGWRHEQLSVVSAWLDPAVPAGRRDLVARLIGTTHGHGRPTFRDGSAALLDPASSVNFADGARDLFDVGVWEQVVESTDVTWGVWFVAYLEAVLRAADGAVSSGIRGNAPVAADRPVA